MTNEGMLIIFISVMGSTIICLSLLFRTSRKEKQIIKDHNTFNQIELREEKVKNATFEIKSVMNKGEAHALECVNMILRNIHSKYIAYPQIPLKAMMRETSRNAKQLQGGLYSDIAILNKEYIPVLVIEIDGKGHFNEKDHLKDKLLSAVGIPVIRVDTSNWNNIKPKPYYKDYVCSRVNEELQRFIENNSDYFSD